MAKAKQVKRADDQGFAIASLVLGILAIVTSAVLFISMVLGILAIVFGVIAVRKSGSKMAIAGIVTGTVGIILGLLIVWMVSEALPALQQSQRDTARKNDLSVLATNTLDYQTNNSGQLPAASDLSTSRLGQIATIASEGQPTTDSAVYTVGSDCDGAPSERAYAITVKLESGTTYCQGS